MTPIYPDIKLYVDLDNNEIPETDISARVVTDLRGEHGIFNYKDTERLPSIGSLTFSLNNADGAYTDSAALIGKAVRVSVTYGGIEKNALFGRIINVTLDSGTWGSRQAHVTVSDWMNTANKTRPLGLLAWSDKRADEALTLLLDKVSVPPPYTDFDTGMETFLDVFDGSKATTKVYSELDKIAKSELGYIYLKYRPQLNGETIKLENYLARGSTRTLDKIPSGVVGSFIRKHGPAGDNGYLKQHGPASTSGKIKIHSAEYATFNNEHIDGDWNIGENVINDFTATIIQRTRGSSVIVLYTHGDPMQIGTLEKPSMNGDYHNPDGGNKIPAWDVVTPVATTDYLFNELEDGTGADYTANLQVFFAYTASQFSITFRNLGPVGYLTFFQVRGKGIFKNTPTDYNVESVESKEDFVKTEIGDNITREYSSDLRTSKTFADGVVAINRYPNKTLKSVTFNANTEKLLMAFMHLEQGDKIEIVETSPAHTGSYYIQGVKFVLNMGGTVYFTWFLKEAIETICEPIAVRGTIVAHPAEWKNALDFGILPYLANMTQFSYSAWVKIASNDFPFCSIVSRTVDDGAGRRGSWFYVQTNGTLHFLSYKTPTDGGWYADAVVGTDDAWHHVAVVYDNTSDTQDPAFFVDGVVVTAVEDSPPSGTSDDDSDCPVVLFSDTPDPAIVGQEYGTINRHCSLKDVRIYNRLLTSAEIAELAAAEDDYTTVQDGLLFNGIFAPSENIADYIDDQILPEDLVIDSVHAAVGTPYNEVAIPDAIMYGRAI